MDLNPTSSRQVCIADYNLILPLSNPIYDQKLNRYAVIVLIKCARLVFPKLHTYLVVCCAFVPMLVLCAVSRHVPATGSRGNLHVETTVERTDEDL